MDDSSFLLSKDLLAFVVSRFMADGRGVSFLPDDRPITRLDKKQSKY